jgi:hypothetical protein
MGARLALAKADITGPGITDGKGRTVQAIGQVLRVLRGAYTELERTDLDRADRTGPTTWRLTMRDGDTFELVRGKGCGCHGGR